jgi:hypothetical protein
MRIFLTSVAQVSKQHRHLRVSGYHAPEVECRQRVGLSRWLGVQGDRWSSRAANGFTRRKADVREWASATLSGRGCPIGYAVGDYCAVFSRPITVSIVSAIRAKAEVWVAEAHDTAATMASASSCHVGPLPGPSIRSSFPFRGPGSDL